MPKQTLKTFKEQLEENGMIIDVQLEQVVEALASINETPFVLLLKGEFETIRSLPSYANGETPIVLHNEKKIILIQALNKVIEQL